MVEQKFFNSFGKSKAIQIDFVESLETVRSLLDMYQELLVRRSPQPDLYEIDVIWAAILANDLIDLRPYFKNEVQDFDPEIIRNFTVGGRLIALPTFLDVGVLFYRPDLLLKYGFKRPPTTWEQLEEMATVIQAGERRAGQTNFWGYVWQGGSYEALTCNATEWQASTDGSTFIASDGSVQVNDPRFISTIQRAFSWIGRISPPGEAFYREMDSSNLFNEGQAAFMRNWTSSYSQVKKTFAGSTRQFRIAALPGGPGGQRGTLGGLAMGVSKYSQHKELAVAALRGLTNVDTQVTRALVAGAIPTRIALRQNKAVMAQTALPSDIADAVIGGAVARPSKVSGGAYAEVSKAYFEAVHSVLAHEKNANQAIANLEIRLVSIDRRKFHSN